MDLSVDRPASAEEEAVAAVHRSLAALAERALDLALSEAETGLQRRPGFPAAFHALGLAALRLGRLGTAIGLFERAHAGDPATREHAEALAICYAAAGRLVDSLYYGKLATALPPSTMFAELLPEWMGNFADHFRAIEDDPLVARGRALLAGGRAEMAAVLFQQEIELDRNTPAAWRGLGQASLAAARPQDAVVAYRALCALRPDSAEDLSALGRALGATGRHEEALSCHRQACELSPDPGLRAALIAACVANPGLPLPQLVREIEAAARRDPPIPRMPQPPMAAMDGRALRIGFVSARFRAGAGLDLFLPLIEARNRQSWHAFLYFDGAGNDGLARRLRNAAAVTEIGDVDDETAALVIGNDRLDLLIDLDLHQPGWRGEIALRHPAAAVAGWLGLDETRAALGYDAMIGDEWTRGHGEDGALTMRGGLFCLPADLAAVPKPARLPDPPVFTTPARPAQITAETVALWAQLLAAVPQAVFRLDPARLGGRQQAEAMRELFVPREVGGQVIIAEGGPEGDLEGDIVLDPPGIGGAAETVLGALRAGVPVVSLPGTIPERRQVASLLAGLGLDGLIAADPQDYIAIARSLASPTARQAVGELILDGLARPGLAPAARAAAFHDAARRFLAERGRP
ncbi:MAG: hypothetical protein JO267_12530 [Alphaproteobacteria bacterium]|nr:hypothetical protein [Alphaproteobacteria bacterium]